MQGHGPPSHWHQSPLVSQALEEHTLQVKGDKGNTKPFQHPLYGRCDMLK